MFIFFASCTSVWLNTCLYAHISLPLQVNDVELILPSWYHIISWLRRDWVSCVNCCNVIFEGRDDSDNINVLLSHLHAAIILCAICALSRLLADMDWNVVGNEKEKSCTVTVFEDELQHQLMTREDRPMIVSNIFFIEALVS